ncbi:MAG: cell division protein FtsX, partial [Bacteroidia bacterium]
MSAYKLKISWKTSWSLSLILFILGLTAVVFSYARYVKQAVKQDIRMQVFVDSKTSTSELHTIFKSLNQLPQIDTVFSVSKEVAAKQLKHDLGEDVLAFLDENPLYHVFEIRLAENATESSILASLQRTISAWHGVSEVMFERDYIDRLNLNIKYLSYALFFLG